MDLFTVEFWQALMAIVVIDLVLAGDNAIVIGLAARNLPKGQQKKVIYLGTLGAITIRIGLTLVAFWLLKIPGLMLVGGLLLLWIAFKLLADDKGNEGGHEAYSLGQAIKTILIADTVMSMDNILAVAGAAGEQFLLIVIGLLISIPIVIWGSTIILKLVDRFPVIIYFGAAVLAWTAGKMVVGDGLVKMYFNDHAVLKYGLEIVFIVLILLLGHLAKMRGMRKRQQSSASAI